MLDAISVHVHRLQQAWRHALPLLGDCTQEEVKGHGFRTQESGRGGQQLTHRSSLQTVDTHPRPQTRGRSVQSWRLAGRLEKEAGGEDLMWQIFQRQELVKSLSLDIRGKVDSASLGLQSRWKIQYTEPSRSEASLENILEKSELTRPFLW